jgi:hypothetical protein
MIKLLYDYILCFYQSWQNIPMALILLYIGILIIYLNHIPQYVIIKQALK